LLADREKARTDFLVGFLPADLLPTGGGAPHRAAQPIGIVVQLLQSVGLRADEAAGEGILLVAANADDRLALDLDGEAAGRLAKGTDAMNGTALGHLTPRWNL